jgi:PAS domain-containing protein
MIITHRSRRVMPQEPIELILLKQWASYVALPIWLTDTAGNLIFYNQAAEPILGLRFDEAGEISAHRLAELFVPSDPDGTPVANDELPIVVALTQRLPSHRVLRIEALDGSVRRIEVTALPLIGQGDRHLGAMSVFWELE